MTEIIGATVEFGLIISRRNWSKGVAAEAGNAILYDAWDRFDGAQIHAIVHPDNPAGGAVLRKLGFRRQDDELVRGETQQVWQTQRLG